MQRKYGRYKNTDTIPVLKMNIFKIKNKIINKMTKEILK